MTRNRAATVVPSSDSELDKTNHPLQAASIKAAGKKDTNERGLTPLEEDRVEEDEEEDDEEDEEDEVGAQPVAGGSHGNGESSEKRKASSSLQSGKGKKKPKKLALSPRGMSEEEADDFIEDLTRILPYELSERSIAVLGMWLQAKPVERTAIEFSAILHLQDSITKVVENQVVGFTLTQTLSEAIGKISHGVVSSPGLSDYADAAFSSVITYLTEFENSFPNTYETDGATAKTINTKLGKTISTAKRSFYVALTETKLLSLNEFATMLFKSDPTKFGLYPEQAAWLAWIRAITKTTKGEAASATGKKFWAYLEGKILGIRQDFKKKKYSREDIAAFFKGYLDDEIPEVKTTRFDNVPKRHREIRESISGGTGSFMDFTDLD